MTDAKTEARAIVAAALPPHEQAILGHDAVTVLTDMIATALAAKDAARDEAIFLKDCAEAALVKRESELVAKNAELAAAKAQLIAAWNAFGPSSSRTGKTAFDADDLEHLPRSADGGLDEQIRCLEDRAERAEAQLTEVLKALKAALVGLEAGCGQYATRNLHGGEVPGDEQFPWVRLMMVGRDAVRRAREAQGWERDGSY